MTPAFATMLPYRVSIVIALILYTYDPWRQGHGTRHCFLVYVKENVGNVNPLDCSKSFFRFRRKQQTHDIFSSNTNETCPTTARKRSEIKTKTFDGLGFMFISA